jgi:hypothetical protein
MSHVVSTELDGDGCVGVSVSGCRITALGIPRSSGLRMTLKVAAEELLHGEHRDWGEYA